MPSPSIVLRDRHDWVKLLSAERTSTRKLWQTEGELIELIRLSGEYLFLTKDGRVLKAVPPHPPQPWTAQLVATLPGTPLFWEITAAALIVVVGENPWSPPPAPCAGSGRSAEEVRSWGNRRPGDPQDLTAYSVSAAGDVRRLELSQAPPSGATSAK